MDLEFTGEIVEWRGPAPYFYVAIPEDESEAIGSVAHIFTYGWGCIAVAARIGDTDFTTALFPKDGRYLLPLKVAVRKAAGLGEEGRVAVELSLIPPG